MNNKQEAFHLLIWAMLRGPHVMNMDSDLLRYYTIKAGTALHNLPLIIEKGEFLDECVLSDINKLDPSVSGSEWGEWVRMMCRAFEQPIPIKSPMV